MFFSSLNLNNLESKLLTTLLKNNQNLDTFELPEQFKSPKINESFNARSVTPQNINEIISLCDYIMLKNTEKFCMYCKKWIFRMFKIFA